MLKKIIFCACLSIIMASVSYPALQEIGTSEAIAPENRPIMMEAYRIRIHNDQEWSFNPPFLAVFDMVARGDNPNLTTI